MKTFFYLYFLFITPTITLNVFSQAPYTIPGAQQQPTFVFPIYFEEAGGQRDTLYLGYDSLANGYSINGAPNQDTIFGVRRTAIDTTQFYACWSWTLVDGNGALQDSVHKVNVCNLYANHFPGSDLIRFNKGNLPLKISWDKTLLYSDSLPFPNNSPAPRAQGRFIIDFGPEAQISENGNIQNNSNVFYRTIITDSIILSWSTVHDSVTISNYFNNPQSVNSGLLAFTIEPWTGISVDNLNISKDHISIYPNPFEDLIHIQNVNIADHLMVINIYDLKGNRVYSSKINFENEQDISLSHLEEGNYVIELITTKNHIRKLLFKNSVMK